MTRNLKQRLNYPKLVIHSTDNSFGFGSRKNNNVESDELFIKKMVRIKSIVGSNFSDKTCILRLDLNIPLSEDGEILDDTRILESIPTIDYLINQSAKVIIISHIGRPKGKFNKNYSFKPLIQDISKRINRKLSKI